MNTTSTKTRILVVEDEIDIRELMQEWLEIEGYAVDAACDGQDALNRLRASSDGDLPDLILLDLMMPVKDGFAFRTEQEEDLRLSSIPVVVVSADAHIEEKKIKLRARAAMRKPIDFDRLLEILVHEATAPRG